MYIEAACLLISILFKIASVSSSCKIQWHFCSCLLHRLHLIDNLFHHDIFTSGKPPALVLITGMLAAIASSAARPKLSYSDGRINKIAYHQYFFHLFLLSQKPYIISNAKFFCQVFH